MRLQETRFYEVNGNKCVTALGDVFVVDRRSDLNNKLLFRGKRYSFSIRFLFDRDKNTRANSEVFLLQMYVGPAVMNPFRWRLTKHTAGNYVDRPVDR